jgi:hypothetical protein
MYIYIYIYMLEYIERTFQENILKVLLFEMEELLYHNIDIYS